MVLNFKNNFVRIGIHIFVWLIIFMLPYLLFPSESANHWKLIRRTVVPFMQYAIVFYSNYFVFTQTFLFKKKFVLFFVINGSIIVLFLWLNWHFRDFFTRMELPRIPVYNALGQLQLKPHISPNFFVLKEFFSLCVPVIFSISIRATERWINAETEKKDIENRNLESELLHLRYQLQPHFFFNSLNNIYSLIEVSPAKAQEAVHGLSKLMRYLLYDTEHKQVELSQELSFLQKYIQLMELRQTDKINTTYSFPETTSNQKIAPLLLIPIIENAYKHGISATQQSNISFKIVVDHHQLFFSSENTNFPKNSLDKSGSGIGLTNLKKRLELLYPNKYELKFGVRDSVYWIILSIEIN